jgi:hypothetical protein
MTVNRSTVLNPSMAVAGLALLVAVGGTSYAAVQLPKNSVGSAQIKKGAVKSADVKNGGLKAVDFAAGQLPAGPKGDAGPIGPPGAVGVITGSATLPSANTGMSLDGRLQGVGLEVSTLSPNVPASISNFRIELESPAPAGTGRGIQLRVNEQITALCAIAAGESACTQTQPVAVPPGSTLRLVITSVNGGGVVLARWGMTIGVA